MNLDSANLNFLKFPRNWKSLIAQYLVFKDGKTH